jgi:hypothetical protein
LLVGSLALLAVLDAPRVSASESPVAACPAHAWSPPAAGGLPVSGAAGLDGALARTLHGGTILLAGGDYGKFELAGYNPSGAVTIGAADPRDPPVFDSLMIGHSSNLTLAGLKFQVDGSKAFSIDDLDPALRILDSSGITILGSFFTGFTEPPGSVYPVWDFLKDKTYSVDFSGLGRGKGLDVRRSDRIEVLGSTFADLTVGSDVNRVRDARFVGNTYTGISVDSTDWGGIDGLLFQGNLIANNPVPRGVRHADLMQFRFSASKDVTIEDNVLVSARAISHGIYLGGSVFDNYRYDNIVIRNNVLLASQRLALAVERADGLTITGNTVLANRAARGGPAAILVEETSTGVTISGNTANIIGAAGRPNWIDGVAPKDWSLDGNRILRGGADAPALGRAPGCKGP